MFPEHAKGVIAIRYILTMLACLCLTVGASPGCWAEVNLVVAEKGSYVYWFSYKDASGEEQTTLPQRFKGTEVELDTKPLGDKYSDARLYVMDKATGNMAVKDFPPGEGETVELTDDDFQYVRCVKLRIISEDDRPIESAIVTITDGMNTRMRAVVTPADRGVATFRDVATGEINVKVEARGLKKTIDSDITLPDKRDTPDFEHDIRVAGDVDTLAVPAETARPAPEEPRAEPESPPPARGGASWVLQTVAGILFLLVVIAIIYAVVKAKGLTAESALRKMGVQLPQDQEGGSAPVGAQPAPPAVDPNVCQFCGQRRDAAGNCACTVVPGAAPAANTAAAAGVPRLVGTQGAYSGHIFEIAGPSVVIGREAGNDIALSDDSTVSRKHAVISIENGEYTITDQGSSNGTFVNGARITTQRLAPGDEIQIGGTKFRFEV